MEKPGKSHPGLLPAPPPLVFFCCFARLYRLTKFTLSSSVAAFVRRFIPPSPPLFLASRPDVVALLKRGQLLHFSTVQNGYHRRSVTSRVYDIRDSLQRVSRNKANRITISRIYALICQSETGIILRILTFVRRIILLNFISLIR